MLKKKISVHGHFYQPARENPLTGNISDDSFVIEQTAGKYRNWNELINSQCYRPNSELGNFELISYDLYRSLAEWLEKYDNLTYKRIINADNHNYITYGYGNAFAYPYDHIILPLLNEDDIDVEVYWGIRDFFNRYKHMPIAFWLPETAINLKTLCILERNNIKFTILAPWQIDPQYTLDTEKLYKCSVGRGKYIDIFFYDGIFSGDLSFNNGEMANADTYVNEYLPKSIHKNFNIAALDGERFGHHLPGGELFLKQMLRDLFSNSQMEMVNIVNEYMSRTEKTVVRIAENSAWSCHHGGLARWQKDCDCNYDTSRGKRVSGNWKTQLLSAFRVLSAQVDVYFEQSVKRVVADSLQMKREYINVILKIEDIDSFIDRFLIKGINQDEKKKIGILLEMQVYKLSMFVSDTFFFADVDRPEPRLNIKSAAKVIKMFNDIDEHELAEKLETEFVSQLEDIRSNFTSITAKDIYYE